MPQHVLQDGWGTLLSVGIGIGTLLVLFGVVLIVLPEHSSGWVVAVAGLVLVANGVRRTRGRTSPRRPG